MNHIERVEKALSEIDHLEYSEVEKPPKDDDADVRVRVAGDVENSIVNNGEWAQFHRAGYLGHHIDYDEEYIDLRYHGDLLY